MGEKGRFADDSSVLGSGNRDGGRCRLLGGCGQELAPSKRGGGGKRL